MSDVFLLGAGFSHAISERMPLLAALGDEMAYRLPRDYGWFDLETQLNLEEMLTFLATPQPWLSEAENLRNQAEFLDISRRMAVVLSRAESAVLSHPMPEWLMPLVQGWHDQGVEIVTLNYDTLVEHALTELFRQSSPKLGSVVAHAHSYAVPIQSAMARSRLVHNPYEGTRTLGLMKLHGSLNWRYSGSTSSRGEEIYDVGVIPGWDPKPLPREATSAAIDKVPLVVPPTFGKSPFFTNETVAGTWRSAFRALSRADSIYALGYSLPEADHSMIGLLRDAIGNRQEVHVVNRSVDVASRYERLLRGRVSTEFAESGVESFANQYAAG